MEMDDNAIGPLEQADADEPMFVEDRMKYDLQYVFVVDDDKTIRNFAWPLHSKHEMFSSLYYWYRCENLTLVEGARQPLVNSMNTFRIYLCGHGTKDCKTIAGLDGAYIADKLKAVIFGVVEMRKTPVIHISLVTCYSASLFSKQKGYGHSILDNLAANLHRELNTRHGIKVTVAGRTRAVSVVSSEEDGTQKIGKFVGDEITDEFGRIGAKPGTLRHKTGNDKIVYYWDEAGKQRYKAPYSKV